MSEPIETRLEDDTLNPSTAPPEMPKPELSEQEKNMGMFCHLAALSGYVIPMGWLVGPLILWLAKKETMPYVNQEGKKSINFQITILLYSLISGVLCLIFIGFLLLFGLTIFNLIMVIVNGIKAGKGEETRYPLSITFIK
jgi:uncharacterized Tic20 family protein